MKLKMKTKLSLTRRWRNARPGSVLILVVALLVLLALIGTAYLSSTQGERYTSSQNTINTEADLLIQGTVDTVNATVAGGLFGNNGTQYRAPQQEMPNAGVNISAGAPTRTGYYNYDSVGIDATIKPGGLDPGDLFLGSRIPTIPVSTGTPTWSAISWPLFKDSNGYCTFDSPFEASTTTYYSVNKGAILSIPYYKTSTNGQIYPAMLYYVPQGAAIQTPNPAGSPAYLTYTAPAGGAYLTPTGIISGAPAPSIVVASGNTYASLAAFAADADGDGIADAGFVKLPIGPVDGITYYAAVRVIDGNSAINASSAWTQGSDVPFNSPTGTANPTTNYGFFRSNIGLQELLISTTSATEMAALNSYRLTGVYNASATLSAMPPSPVNSVRDPYILSSAPTNFSWYSYGDALERQMTARANAPGFSVSNGVNFQWLGLTQTAALAYKYALGNPSAQSSPLEQTLTTELAISQTTPYPASQTSSTGAWWTNNFSGLFPATYYQFTGYNSGSSLRTLLVGSNGVSNGVPSRLGSLSGGATSGASTWSNAGVTYHFGDWVIDPLSGTSYVCLCTHVSSAGNEPNTGFPTSYSSNTAAVGLWAGIPVAPTAVSNLRNGLPYTHAPVKACVNTAPFEELYLNFCQLMTDSVSKDLNSAGTAVGNSQWQPPMRADGTALNGEYQLPMFHNVIRGSTSLPATMLTSSQMLKLRAACAAVNTLDLRDSDDDVTSHRIILTDDAGDAPTPANAYDVEVYGVEMQPYVGQVYIHIDSVTPKNDYYAVQLVNPYPKDIVIQSSWQFASVNRSTSPNLTLTPIGTVAASVTVPAATASGPGIAVISGLNAAPIGYVQPSSPAQVGTVLNLESAIGKELVILKPRLASGMTSSLTTSSSFGDYYNEVSNVSDLVPVDQVDSTGAGVSPTSGGTVADYYYHRASDPTKSGAWGFVFPGKYTPGGSPPQPFGTVTINPPSPTNPLMSSLTSGVGVDPTGGNALVPTFPTVPVVINNVNMAGPNRLTPPGGTYQFPFGGFMRNADILQIPFIASYRIRPYSPTALNSNSCTEMNSITMDSSLVQDVNAPQPSSADMATTTPAFKEQLGRFCPVGDPGLPSFDFIDDPTSGPTNWHYHWAKKIFDYFTVQSPADEHYPFSDPAGPSSAGTASPQIAGKYSPAVGPYPSTVNTGSNPDTIGVEGLININTGSAPVIAQIPFVVPTPVGVTPIITAAQAIQDNAALAQEIVAFRDGGTAYINTTTGLAAIAGSPSSSPLSFTAHGPFHTIFDLYKVPGFLNQNTAVLNTPTVPGPNQGIFTPNGIGSTATTGDGVRYDFKERFLLLNNISNLITTRSDTFTCYVLLQGWRNVGTGNPTLVVQRRAAFLLDRGVVTPSNNKPFNFNVPTD